MNAPFDPNTMMWMGTAEEFHEFQQRRGMSWELSDVPDSHLFLWSPTGVRPRGWSVFRVFGRDGCCSVVLTDEFVKRIRIVNVGRGPEEWSDPPLARSPLHIPLGNSYEDEFCDETGRYGF